MTHRDVTGSSNMLPTTAMSPAATSTPGTNGAATGSKSLAGALAGLLGLHGPHDLGQRIGALLTLPWAPERV